MPVVARCVLACFALVLATLPLHAQGRGDAPPAGAETVPNDLRALLAPRRSEMRLVTLRYTADRSLLSGNYAGAAGGRGQGGGRGGAAAPVDTLAARPLALSPARIARLKRFDLDWQNALALLPAGGLSQEARAGLDSLKTVIAKDVAQLDDDAASLANFLPLFPFAPKIVALVESRMHLEDVNPELAAGMLTQVTRDVGAMRASFSPATGAPVRLNRADAARAGAAVDALKRNLAEWFGFYNTYDPMFTWWMGLPYKHVDAALSGYAAFLRDSAATPDARAWSSSSPVSATIAPAAEPRYAEVPDLRELVALPQDEMADVVERFLGPRATRGAPVRPPRDSSYYTGWMRALHTLDFDHLTRNAQVDYLFIKRTSELQLARVGVALPANPPRLTDSSGITGAARGREGLVRDLQDEFIPYSPEQLIALAEREFAWCEAEMKKASRQMGFGDDWKAALEKTKGMHVAPGGQPAMIRDLIFDAIGYLRAHDLVTVPEVDAESQRMIMMSPEAQLVSPFFLGGSLIQVSFPTDGMEFDAREQSMRGNNRPWSHATAFHEMIPGHNLSGYLNQRYAGYRADLRASTPFYVEGWAVYWETILYDKGFDATPEEKVGALFWRMHRCARIIFSLKFHMGQWSPQQAVDFLVDRVGHERDNATAEVRRSFQGGYGPLYQAGYLLGALELRGLRREVVDSKQMTEKAFHDEILHQGAMPIALLKLGLSKQKLTPDTPIEWKFYGELPGSP